MTTEEINIKKIIKEIAKIKNIEEKDLSDLEKAIEIKDRKIFVNLNNIKIRLLLEEFKKAISNAKIPNLSNIVVVKDGKEVNNISIKKDDIYKKRVEEALRIAQNIEFNTQDDYNFER